MAEYNQEQGGELLHQSLWAIANIEVTRLEILRILVDLGV
jgi:hypothetical protein